jgi:hypothetical protein
MSLIISQLYVAQVSGRVLGTSRPARSFNVAMKRLLQTAGRCTGHPDRRGSSQFPGGSAVEYRQPYRTRKASITMAPAGPFSAAGVARLPGLEPGDPAIAPIAGAITSHNPIVTTMDVVYPNVLIPSRSPRCRRRSSAARR